MTKQVQRRRGTATQHTSFTGAEGELSVNTTNKSVHVHDNVTAGGFEAARVDMDNVTSGSILTAAGITATTAELNYVDGVTSAIQTQLDGKAGTASPTFTGTLTTANLTATGTTTLAGASTSADITFGDNVKATFGNSDLQIYHDGSHSYVDENGTGQLKIRSNGTGVLLQTVSGENLATFANNAAVSLYYDNSVKLATTSTGVNITGTLTSDGLTVNSGTNNTVAKFESSDAGAFIILEDSGSTNDGNRIAVEGDVMSFATGDSERMRISSAGNVGIGTSSPAQVLHLASSAPDLRIEDTDGGYADINVAAGSIELRSDQGNTQANSTLKMFVDGSERMRIDSSGNVGIGTSSPRNASGFVGLTLDDASGSFIDFNDSGVRVLTISGNATGNDINTVTAIPLRFKTNNTERMRIDSSGDMLVLGGTVRIKDSGNTSQRGAIYGDASSFHINAGVNNLIAYSAGSEAMRLDSSGTLLVGKTASDSGTVGFEAAQDGHVYVTVNNTLPLYINRQSGDELLRFASNGATVGSIASVGGSDIKVVLSSDGDQYITGNATSNYMTFSAANQERMRIDSSGKLSITASDQGIQIGPDIAAYTIKRDSSGLLNFRATQATFNGYIFDTVDGERMRIDSSGRVGIGTSSPSSYYAQKLVVDCGSDVQNGITIASGTGNSGMFAFADGTSGDQRYRGFLNYNHANDSLAIGTVGTERMRITSGGKILAGQTTVMPTFHNTSTVQLSSATQALSCTSTGAGSQSPVAVWRQNAAGFLQYFTYGTNNTKVGDISTNGTSTSYNTSSDHRLKENVVELAGATTRLKQLEPKRFNFIADADTTVDGFLAHEVQSVVPEAIHGTKDAVDADGNPVYQGIDQSKLVPLLVATIKELEARITALENA